MHRIKFPSFDAIKRISDGQPAHEIEKELKAKLNQDIIDQARKNLRSSDMADEKWTKPLLLLIEYDIIDGSKPGRIKLNRSLHLEHVLPEEWESVDGWKHFSKNKEAVDEYLNSAGNITLLISNKNSAIKNKPFKEKVKAYQGENLHTKNAQGITAFEITQKICEDYDDGIYQKEWNEEAMRARQEWFLDQVETILGIKDK